MVTFFGVNLVCQLLEKMFFCNEMNLSVAWFDRLFQDFSLDGSRLLFSSEVKVNLNTNLLAHQAGTYPGFRGMERLGLFLVPSALVAIPLQDHPLH